MKPVRIRAFCLKALGAALLLGAVFAAGPQATGAEPPLALKANDVSILFPLPQTNDMSSFLALADLVGNDGQRLLSDAAFKKFIEVSRKEGKVGTTAIDFPPELEDIKAWFVAGIRFDVGAPGLSDGVKAKFGLLPQVRLIVQPVTFSDGVAEVHDRAAHIIFNVGMDKGAIKAAPKESQEACTDKVMPVKFESDPALFKLLLQDLVALRGELNAGKFGEAPKGPDRLGVYPGFDVSKPTDKKHAKLQQRQKLVRDALKTLLQNHLNAKQVAALAVMSLPDGQPEPWIFMAMRRLPDDNVVAEDSPTLDKGVKAQMLSFIDDVHVQPVPHNDNQNADMTTCRRPLEARKGVSTAELIDPKDGKEPTGKKILAVTSVIADPAKSHFFNTDCVSCHTETRLVPDNARKAAIKGIDVNVLPVSTWNVRNFGWGLDDDGFKPTVTRRTATETDEVVKAANELLKKN